MGEGVNKIQRKVGKMSEGLNKGRGHKDEVRFVHCRDRWTDQ